MNLNQLFLNSSNRGPHREFQTNRSKPILGLKKNINKCFGACWRPLWFVHHLFSLDRSFREINYPFLTSSPGMSYSLPNPTHHLHLLPSSMIFGEKIISGGAHWTFLHNSSLLVGVLTKWYMLFFFSSFSTIYIVFLYCVFGLFL